MKTDLQTDRDLSVQIADAIRDAIISGALTITNADGVAETFGPGEVVFASKGAKMTWQITERLRKYYMTSA